MTSHGHIEDRSLEHVCIAYSNNVNDKLRVCADFECKGKNTNSMDKLF